MTNRGLQSASVSKVLQISLVSAMLVSFSTIAGQDTESEKNAKPPLTEEEKAGKEVVFSRIKGNCLSCHIIQEGEAAGNIAPPLIYMKSRFPDKKMLRIQIWDSTVRNPESSMPPFGRHKIISEKEIDQATAYVWTL